MSAIVPLAVLALALPFEPMKPLGVIWGFELSLLELTAGGLLLCSGLALTREGRGAVPLGPAAVFFLAACLVSTIWADEPRLLPFKASLRVLAGIVVFFTTSLALAVRQRFRILFGALAIAGLLAATIGLIERANWPDPLPGLRAFREQVFEVGGSPRITGTFSYPNLLGGFLVATIPFALYFFRSRPRSSFFAAVVMYLGVLLTHSRGALLGALTGTFLFWALTRTTPFFARLHGAFCVVTVVAFLSDPTFRWRISSEGDRSWYQARIEPMEKSLALAPAELTQTNVKAINAGKLTWAGGGSKPIHLSYRWFRKSGEVIEPVAIEGERTSLGREVAPGESILLASTVRAPRNPGNYLLVWDMVHEHTTWFSDKVGLGSPVTVTVGDVEKADSQKAPQTARTVWRPGRLELWTSAFHLFASRPLLGVGPDNFRWLYGPAAGHDEWDTRTFSNSLYLELLATTGILGTAAFAILMGSALGGLLARPLPILNAAILCSLAGVLVHGLLDYLFEATPLYLTFWMTLGAASAAIRRPSS
ncbi:MAG TPA: O-antigen ligase family protein [Vicinamibacteria bacterium]|nr:O-antigen ligase family protein [Vicinamibacteria bacterium]